MQVKLQDDNGNDKHKRTKSIASLLTKEKKNGQKGEKHKLESLEILLVGMPFKEDSAKSTEVSQRNISN